MPGDAPQPAETPRAESHPGALGEPDPSWWPADTDPAGAGDESGRPRHPRRRPPQTANLQTGGASGTLFPPAEQQPYAPEAAGARGARGREPDPAIKQRAGEPLRTEPGGVERDHNRPDPFRYDPLRPPAGYSGMAGLLAEGPAAETPPPPFAQPPTTQPPTTQPAPAQASPAHPLPSAAQTSAALPSHPQTSHPQTSHPQASAAQTSAAQTSAAQTSAAQTSAAQTSAAAHASGAPADAAEHAGEQARAEPRHAEPEPPVTPAEPDVMVLPEPDDRNRPTVPLERGPVPGQGRTRPAESQSRPAESHTRPTEPHTRPTEPLPRWAEPLPRSAEPLPRPTGDAATDARLEKLENSPFWLNEAERAAAGPLPGVSSHTAGRVRRSRRGRRGAIRRPARPLFALITLALLATFFAWVSAEPFWLAVGHGAPGYATTTACRGSGVTQRCAGRFDAADGSFAVARVTLLGVADDKRASGAVTPARMVSAGSRTAYLGDTGLLVHLRWMLGFALVLICGYGIASLTGARRLDDARARRLMILASLAAPAVLLAGFLFAAY